MSRYVYRARAVRVVDGDTVWLDVDLGFYMTARICFRLLGINAPEMKGETLGVAKRAKDELAAMLEDEVLEIETSKADKYGRFLARVFVVEHGGARIDVGAALLERGLAVPYDGRNPG